MDLSALPSGERHPSPRQNSWGVRNGACRLRYRWLLRGFLDDLPSDVAKVGKAVRLVGYDEDGP